MPAQSKLQQAIVRIETDPELNPEGLTPIEWLREKKEKGYGSGAAREIERLLGLGKNGAYRLFKMLRIECTNKDKKHTWKHRGNFQPERREESPELQQIHQLIAMARKGDTAAKRQLWDKYEIKYYNYAKGDVPDGVGRDHH